MGELARCFGPAAEAAAIELHRGGFRWPVRNGIARAGAHVDAASVGHEGASAAARRPRDGSAAHGGEPGGRTRAAGRGQRPERPKEVVDGKKVTVYDEVEKKIKKDQPSRLHARREMLKVLYTVKTNDGTKKGTKEVDLVAKLFDEIAPKYADRNGGYTRIVKIGQRKGDGALEVLLELV